MDHTQCREVVSCPGKIKTPDGKILYIIGETIYSNKDESAKLMVATQKPSNTSVAIKALSLLKENDPWRELEKFQKASTLEGVIPLLRCLQDKEYLYLIMPYMKKGDLFSLVEKRGELPEDQARTYLKKMADILIRLKQTFGIAHHDVSLENFMINDENDLLLIDFGISVCDEDKDKQHPHIYYGKPCYVAPELVHYNKDPDLYASDVWSLGVCFYNMLTAALLYEKPSTPEFRLLEKGCAYSILKQDKAISPEARWLICRMLNPDPSRRPPLHDIPMLSCKENNRVRWKDCFNNNNKTINQNYKTCVLI